MTEAEMMTNHSDVHISVLCQRLSEFKLPMPPNGKCSSPINVIVAPLSRALRAIKTASCFRICWQMVDLICPYRHCLDNCQ